MNNNPAIQNASESIQVATVNRPSKIAQIHLKNIPITDMIFSEQSFYVYRYFYYRRYSCHYRLLMD